MSWREAWATEADFKSPESAEISRADKAIFVSNVNGYERNGKGFISRLSLNGEVEELIWLDGLNAPTGLAVDGDTLWAVDFDRLAEIDIPTKSIRAFYSSPDENPLLNDVSVDERGEVFVTGSATNAVYALKGEELVLWTQDSERLKFANGIHVTSKDVIVAAYHLVRIERASGAMEMIGEAELLFDLEGVQPDGANGFYVSVIGDRPLYHVNAAGETTPLFKGRSFLADFDISEGLFVAPAGADIVLGFEAR